MLQTMPPARGAIRREADRIEAIRGRGRFCRRRSAQPTPEEERVVLAAVAAARGGDPDALRLLYLRYADGVYAKVCSVLRDEHDAEDVTQQVFARLPGALRRYEPRATPFAAWLGRVAHNAALDHRRVRRPVPVEEVRSEEAPDDAGTGRERFAELRVALAALPDDQRDVLLLRFLVGLTPGEVAERLGRTEDAVNGLQHRGRRRLRRELPALAA